MASPATSISKTVAPVFFVDRPVIRWTLCLITFAFIFVFHTYALGLSDFWWHLSTGRWIWEHGTVPNNDPFLFTSVAPPNDQALQILRGYPLAQLLFLASYTLGGIYALLVLKGLLMTLLYGSLWNQLRSNGLHPVLALCIVALLPIPFFRFDDLRPQMFTFIFTLLVFQFIEYIIARERRGDPLKVYVMLLLPFAMLLWANLHGGFIIGIGLLLIHLFAEWKARAKGRDRLSDESYRRLLAVFLLSIGATLLNPGGITALWASFAVVSGPFAKVIDEYFGTLKYFQFHGFGYMGYIVLVAAFIPVFSLPLKWRELRLAHMLMVPAFLVAGIMSFRFSLLMVAVCIVIACSYFARDLNRRFLARKGIPLLILWCATTGLMADIALNRTALAGSPLEAGVFPAAAVDYLERYKPPGNLYNFYEYGGYLGWRLYPQKIFIDQRGLSWDVYEEYSDAWRGDYPGVFDKYKIGVVLYPVHENQTGKPSRLVGGLLYDSGWGIGYYDGRNIVFVRNGINSQLPILDKQKVVEHIRTHLGS